MPSSRKARWSIAAAALVAVGAMAAWAQLGARGPKLWTAKVVAAYPHDPTAFTQGLVIHEGRLYESTGQYGASSVRLVDLETGNVEKGRRLGPGFFAEGIAILGDRLYQLTWQNRVAIVYDVGTFDVLETFQYEGEGWGLTHDGRQLIMSDGSSEIRFLDPATFEVERTIVVRDGDLRVDRLNELEYVEGEIWANVWYDDRIVRISPEDGRVLGWIDLSHLYPASRRPRDDVLNGIAYDAAAKRIFVTGKNWPRLFEIELARR
ncbi:MAG TPA: glutaminyl-peptide cyclotransferase [Gammaproteobacteria bacterium]